MGKRVQVCGHARSAEDMSLPANAPTGPHWMVRIGCRFIDFTRRQFEPDASFPTVYGSLGELRRDWLCLSDGDEGDFQPL